MRSYSQVYESERPCLLEDVIMSPNTGSFCRPTSGISGRSILFLFFVVCSVTSLKRVPASDDAISALSTSMTDSTLSSSSPTNKSSAHGRESGIWRYGTRRTTTRTPVTVAWAAWPTASSYSSSPRSFSEFPVLSSLSTASVGDDAGFADLEADRGPWTAEESRIRAAQSPSDDDADGVTLGAASLTFVFDVTGSMHDDLVQVIEGAANILATTLAMRHKPLHNYVLVPVHDPGKSTPSRHQRSFRGGKRGNDVPVVKAFKIERVIDDIANPFTTLQDFAYSI